MHYKKLIKFSIAVFIIAGFIMILGKREWFPDFYTPLFAGTMSFVSAFLIFLPKILFKTENPAKEKYITELQAFVSIALLLNGAGALGLFQLYKIGFQYDKLIHFTVPFLMAIEGVRLFNIFKENSFKKSLIKGSLWVFTGGVVWEILEFFSDLIFKTKTWGVYGNYVWADTIGDLSFNLIGIIAAIFILIFFNKKSLPRNN